MFKTKISDVFYVINFAQNITNLVENRSTLNFKKKMNTSPSFSFSKVGMNKNFIPSQAPSKVKPFTKSIDKSIYGNRDVK